MNEEIKNINPWAEKLEQVTLPDVNEQWPSMQELLDREMPDSKKKRRFLFFWIFTFMTAFGLVLFFSIKNNFNKTVNTKKTISSNSNDGDDKKESSGKNFHADKKTDSTDADKLITKEKKESINTSKNNSGENAIDNKNKKLLTRIYNTPDKNKTEKKLTDNKIITKENKNSYNKKDEKYLASANSISENKFKKPVAKKLLIKDNNNPSNRNHIVIAAKKSGKHTDNLQGQNDLPAVMKNDIATLSHKNKGNKKIKHPVNYYQNKKPNLSSANNIKSNTDAEKNNADKNSSYADIVQAQMNNNDDGKQQKNNIPGIAENSDTSKINKNTNKQDSSETPKPLLAAVSDSSAEIKKTDSLNKKQPLITKADSLNRKKIKGIGLAAGVGFNQFFPVGNQKYSGINANGNDGALSDYLPVPMLRAYFSKKLFLQLEIEFNAPQYTDNLLIKNKPNVTRISNSLVVTTQDSGNIEKLFYLNIPVSFHYMFFKNFYLGAGLQYSRLMNGVGSFETKRDSSLNSQSTYLHTSFKTNNIKDNSVINELKRNEFRFLFDANYQWKNLIAGIKYTQSFSNFVNVQLSTTQTTKASNSSMQFYVRYILWKDKKVKYLLPK